MLISTYYCVCNILGITQTHTYVATNIVIYCTIIVIYIAGRLAIYVLAIVKK